MSRLCLWCVLVVAVAACDKKDPATGGGGGSGSGGGGGTAAKKATCETVVDNAIAVAKKISGKDTDAADRKRDIETCEKFKYPQSALDCFAATKDTDEMVKCVEAAEKAGWKAPADKPEGDKTAGDKPPGDKPPGDKPPEDKPAGDKPAAAAAVETGVAECDEYLTKYQKCIDAKMPEEARAATKEAMKSNAEGWKQAATTPEGKKALVDTCKQLMEATKETAKAMGCEW